MNFAINLNGRELVQTISGSSNQRLVTLITIGQFLGSILLAVLVELVFNRGKLSFQGFSWAFFGSILGQCAINAMMSR